MVSPRFVVGDVMVCLVRVLIRVTLPHGCDGRLVNQSSFVPGLISMPWAFVTPVVTLVTSVRSAALKAPTKDGSAGGLPALVTHTRPSTAVVEAPVIWMLCSSAVP